MQLKDATIYTKKFLKMTQKVHFGLKIKQLIDNKKETLEEAAKRIGGTKSNLSKILRKEDVNTALLKQIGDAYGVGFQYFFRDLVQYNQSSQNTGMQVVGEKIINYESTGQKNAVTTKEHADFEILSERLKSCQNENRLLREMIEILKGKQN